MREPMTNSELRTLINSALGKTLGAIPASYGNIMCGVWNCPTEDCPCQLVPRTLGIVLPHSSPPFHCPLCGEVLLYDEEG